MYFIYKITNLINNKVYIGSSSTHRGLQTRWEEHLKAARNSSNPSYNYPLQKGIRKYGIENFKYEIIQEHIVSLEERFEAEQNYIIANNSLTSGQGYNQTLDTYCALADPTITEQTSRNIRKPCCLVDNNENILQTFKSVHDAARFAKTEKTPINITRVCNGEIRSFKNMKFRWLNEDNKPITPNEFTTREKRKKIVGIKLDNPNEVLNFDSILGCANELNLDRSSIIKCLQGQKRYSNVGGYVFRYVDANNEIIENDLPLEQVLSKYICINGEYKTFTEWCEYFNITPQSVYKRMKKYGIGKAEALAMPKRRN